MHRSTWFRRFALAIVLTAASLPARAQTANAPDAALSIDGRNVAIWKPPTGSGPFPLVLFSHGFRGCENQSSYLMRAMATAGMLVAAPNHRDSQCGQPPKPETLDLVENPIPADFIYGLDAAHLGNRRDDIEKARKEVTASYGTLIDTKRTALVGHSLGGRTVLSLAGGRADWKKMDGIVGAVALDPLTAQLGKPENIDVPVLIEVADDNGVNRAWRDIYGKIPSPACQVTYPGALHFAWVDSPLPKNYEQPQFQGATATAVVAFLNVVFGPKPWTFSAAALATSNAGCK